MVIKKIDNKNIFRFKIIAEDKDYKKHDIILSKFGWRMDGKEIKNVYYDKEENKRIYIKENEKNKILKQFRIIGLEII